MITGSCAGSTLRTHATTRIRGTLARKLKLAKESFPVSRENSVLVIAKGSGQSIDKQFAKTSKQDRAEKVRFSPEKTIYQKKITSTPAGPEDLRLSHRKQKTLCKRHGGRIKKAGCTRSYTQTWAKTTNILIKQKGPTNRRTGKAWQV